MNSRNLFKSMLNKFTLFKCSTDNPLIYYYTKNKTQIRFVGYNEQNLEVTISKTNYRTIRIYEDQLISKKQIIESRISHLLGLNTKIHARQTVVTRLNKPEADSFLEQNHIHGTTGAYYKFGLMHHNQLVAIATFSKARTMYDAATYYKSYELERFASRANFQVVGGLSKLLHHFITTYQVKHLMTYVDLDWGDDGAFAKMGFELVGKTPPIYFQINSTTYKRSRLTVIPEKLNAQNLLWVKNSGSHKYIFNQLKN